MNLLVILAAVILVVIVVLMFVIFTMPEDKRPKKKKKDKTEAPAAPVKDWEGIVARLEETNKHLHDRKVALEKKDFEMHKELEVLKAENKQQKEKLEQERGWHQKEGSRLDKREQEFKQLKEELVKLQSQYNEDHSLKLRLDKEMKEVQREGGDLKEKRRALESEVAQLKAKLEVAIKDSRDLTRQNAELKEKKDDVAWVAKTDYVRLEMQLQKKDKELETVRGLLQKEVDRRQQKEKAAPIEPLIPLAQSVTETPVSAPSAPNPEPEGPPHA